MYGGEQTVLNQIANPVLRAIANEGQIRTYNKHTVIINEGDTGDTVFLIVQGMVKVYAVGAEGKEIALNFCGPGEFIGELAIDGEPRTASVMTLEPCTMVAISRAQLMDTISKNPNFALQLISMLIKRTRRATKEVKRLALENVYSRIAGLLEEDGVQRGQVKVLPYKLTQHDLAARVGASREMVNRVLKELSAGGYIGITKKVITIKKKLPTRW